MPSPEDADADMGSNINSGNADRAVVELADEVVEVGTVDVVMVVIVVVFVVVAFVVVLVAVVDAAVLPLPPPPEPEFDCGGT